MRLSPQSRLDLAKVLTITIAYVLFSLFLALYDHIMLGSVLPGQRPENYNLTLNFGLHALAGLVAGTLGGYLLVQVNKRVFRRYSLGEALLKTAGVYLFVYAVITVTISTLIGFSLRDEAAPLGDVFVGAWSNATQPTQLIFFVIWGVIALLTLFLLQVYDKFGPGVLRKFLLGQYFHPQKEERIFMFLDMRSSTTIAERIGTEAYFKLLRDCFSLVTKPILESGGEICQYVGDEIVISWTPRSGFTDANCLRCFDNIQIKLKHAAESFENKYGLVPEFKAGLHCGDVVAGEIGEIKKDIVFSGDVLNATSRIQGLCNSYGEDFLASSITLSRIPEQTKYRFAPIGNLELRGKEERIAVHAVHITAVPGSGPTP